MKSRLLVLGFLGLCGLIISGVLNGWISSNAPIALLPTAVPRPTATPDPRNAINLELVYSSDKESWMQQAAEAWNATNPKVAGRSVLLQIKPLGSQEIVTGLVDTSLKPTMISPASSLQISQINAATIDKRTTIAADAQSLLQTPLVIAAFRDTPADNLQAGPELWTIIKQAMVESDPAKKMTFAQTSPVESNSGLQALILLAYAYYEKTTLSVEDIRDPVFVSWLQAYADSVKEFGSSTDTLIERMAQIGPGQYQAVAAYESIALEYMAKVRIGELRLIYPAQSIWSDHPLAVLDASWVSADQRQAAQQFRDFLLGEEQQRKAVEFGFRPVNPAVALDDPESLFRKSQANGALIDYSQVQVATPSAEVINELLRLWSEQIAPTIK